MGILQGKFKEGDRVQVDDNGNELVFTSAGPLNQQEEALAGEGLH